MISAIELYNDVVIDAANKDQNGPFSYAMFNRMSWRAQLRVIDWLTGEVKEGANPPAPINNKNRDFLSPFISRASGQTQGGTFTKPSDYYTWQAAYRIGGTTPVDCDEEDDEYKEVCKTPITLLGLNRFNERCNTYIEELKPSFSKPYAKPVGKNFEFLPSDIGPIELEYIRYPKRAEIKTKIDPVYNDQIPDPDTTIDFEWDEWARELLIWFIVDTWSNKTRESASKEFNQASKPTQ